MVKRAAYGLKNFPVDFQNVMTDNFSEERLFICIDAKIAIGTTFDEFHDHLKHNLEQARSEKVSLGFAKRHLVSSKHPIKILGSDTFNLLHRPLQKDHQSKTECLNKHRNSDYWWPNMLTDMNKHVNEWHSCQKTKPVPKLHDPPSARVNDDVIGPLQEDPKGHKHILVLIDSFSRFTIIVTLKAINANFTADASILTVSAIFRIPFQIHSDNGPEFSKAVFDELSKFLGIKVSKTIPRIFSAQQHGRTPKQGHPAKPAEIARRLQRLRPVVQKFALCTIFDQLF
ncbi:hypothetical protein P9112_005964 [Eukaryota sp. TZLM1-RC]